MFESDIRKLLLYTMFVYIYINNKKKKLYEKIRLVLRKEPVLSKLERKFLFGRGTINFDLDSMTFVVVCFLRLTRMNS